MRSKEHIDEILARLRAMGGEAPPERKVVALSPSPLSRPWWVLGYFAAVLLVGLVLNLLLVILIGG